MKTYIAQFFNSKREWMGNGTETKSQESAIQEATHFCKDRPFNFVVRESDGIEGHYCPIVYTSN